jgi:hypothetical protein
MKRLFAVTRSRGPGWDNSRPMEGQEDWHSHAAFMNALQTEGFATRRTARGNAECPADRSCR